MTNRVILEGLNPTLAMLRGLSEKKIKAALVASLNDGARAGYDAARREMLNAFDRPTRWTLGSVAYWKAGQLGANVRQPGVFDERMRPQSMRLGEDRLFSRVDLSNESNKQGVAPEKWLTAGIQGGSRRLKRHEVALQRIGVLPARMFIVPGQGAEIDAAGNMSSGQIVQIMSFFRGFSEQGYRANMTDDKKSRLARGTKSRAGFEYFVVRPGSFRSWSRGEGRAQGRRAMQPGIYKRIYLGAGSRIIPVMIFVASPAYQKRFDFYGITKSAAESRMVASFDHYIACMVREARR